VTKKQGRKNNEKIEAKREAKRLKEEAKAKADAEAKAEAEAEVKAKAEKEAKAKADAETKQKAEQDARIRIEVGPATPPETPFHQKSEGSRTDTRAEEPCDYFNNQAVEHVKTEAGSPGDVTPDWTPVATPSVSDAHFQTKSEGKTESPGTSKSSGSPNFTPKTEASVASTSDKKDRVPVPPVDAPTVSGGPPAPAPAAKTKAKPADVPAPKPAPKKVYATSDGESSASPISDWEELYSSDDMSRKPRLANNNSAANNTVYQYNDDTDADDDPEPWNAICVVGFRVYSKDEDLELKVVMEGGALEEGGMGEKGEADLDNAQNNAGGARGRHLSIVDMPVPVPRTGGVGFREEVGYEGDSEEERIRRRERRERRKAKGKRTSGESSESD
jgi:hypothetical protein